MTYVAVTKNLLKDVKQNIADMERNEISTLPQAGAQAEVIRNDPAAVEIIETALWQELYDLKPRLTKYSKNMFLDLQFTKPPTRGIGYYELRLENYDIPRIFVKDSYQSYFELKLDPASHPLFQKFVDNEVFAHEVRARWSKVSTQVAVFIESCKSVNEAVKLWPDVERFLPPEVRVKLAEKATRSSSGKSSSAGQETLKKVDIDLVNMSSVLARLGGSRG